MFPRTRAVATALFVTCLMPSLAQATTITLNSDGVVGAMDGKVIGGDPAKEEVMAEFLLWMGTNDEILVSAATPPANYPNACSNALMPCEYRTGDNDYGATDLTFVGKHDYGNSETPNIHHLGDLYLMVKYDGQNAGYILFYLPDWNSNLLPEFPSEIFDAKYRITHYSAFSGTTNVPDGGTTLALLGGALLGLGGLRRRFKA